MFLGVHVVPFSPGSPSCRRMRCGTCRRRPRARPLMWCVSAAPWVALRAVAVVGNTGWRWARPGGQARGGAPCRVDQVVGEMGVLSEEGVYHHLTRAMHMRSALSPDCKVGPRMCLGLAARAGWPVRTRVRGTDGSGCPGLAVSGVRRRLAGGRAPSAAPTARRMGATTARRTNTRTRPWGQRAGRTCCIESCDAGGLVEDGYGRIIKLA